LDRLGEVFPGYEGYANLMRGGCTEAEFNAVKPDGRLYDLPVGPISHEVSLEVRGRTARFSLPEGWSERECFMLSRPHQPVLHMHSIEMWAPVPGGAIVRLLGVAPIESAEATARDFNTVVASWRW
jgi:hypothetical protein